MDIRVNVHNARIMLVQYTLYTVHFNLPTLYRQSLPFKETYHVQHITTNVFDIFMAISMKGRHSYDLLILISFAAFLNEIGFPS